MHLRSLEMIGFKSFASKTKLDFEPGMTAIVGPNGCGKSNVSDAIRWALGEQSAKALRGGAMQDCIFNGTDVRKPLGMAEVSMTLADCEEALGTDYNEVTLSRRVFRSGEGQYFINKTPCRLKDIQRLFMDTGIGTSSYSFMEQGRIDRILSSRPEDRRAVFEEASGITKFKADKEEAIRKLDHTETNLLRLADVIREVKRQIGSLQRQASKARRYKALKNDLRKVDVYVTKQHIVEVNSQIRALQADMSDLDARLTHLNSEVRDLEHGSRVLGESLIQTEREIGAAHEAGVQAQTTLDHIHELIQLNRQRIGEYQNLSERDTREIDEIQAQMTDKRAGSDRLIAQIETASAEKEAAEHELAGAYERLQQHQNQTDAARAHIQELREKSIETESLISRLQNEHVEIESHERSSMIQRERLTAEKAQLARVTSTYEERQTEMRSTLDEMEKHVLHCEKLFQELEQRRSDTNDKIRSLQEKCGGLQMQSAATQAQVDVLREADKEHSDFPGGARLILDAENPLAIDADNVLGSLSSHIDIDEEYRVALEAALRPWLDAVLVSDIGVAVTILKELEQKQQGSARLLAVQASTPAHGAEGNGTRLTDRIRCSPELKPLLQRIIGNVWFVESPADFPAPIPVNACYVSKNGMLLRGDGCAEFWMAADQTSNPFSHKHVLDDADANLTALEKELLEHRAATSDLLAENQALSQSITTGRRELDQSHRTKAQKEGEYQIISKEAAEARERLETVSFELDNITTEEESGDSAKESIAVKMQELREQRESFTNQIHSCTDDLHQLENRRSELQTSVTEHRIRFSELGQQTEHLATQHEALQTRIEELEAVINGRSTGIQSYEAGIDKLKEAVLHAESRLESLGTEVVDKGARADSLKKNRGKQAGELKKMEDALSHKRASLEQLRDQKGEHDVRFAENKMRRQNLIDRVTSEYTITLEQLLDEASPEWEGEEPGMDVLETNVAELRTKLEAMGPVNLVAIDEHQELEERHAFLTEQENDLIKAKEQLMGMIRKINLTTSEMFRTTFDKVNTNFLAMFKRLFNGGSAKLVLVNEEDVLECGIEIIARPPGKRLQNISLLSGGERTLTAVALLFAIYMIKPSPFCLLDELDAALDDSNIGRFVKIVQDFLEKSQFVVITHNRQTIAAANVLYGVTMPEKGISSIVSMKFTDAEPVPVKAS